MSVDRDEVRPAADRAAVVGDAADRGGRPPACCAPAT